MASQTDLFKVVNCEEDLWICYLLFSSFVIHFPLTWRRVNSLVKPINETSY